MGINQYIKQISLELFGEIIKDSSIIKLIADAELYWYEQTLILGGQLDKLQYLDSPAKESYQRKLKAREMLRLKYNYDYLEHKAIDLHKYWDGIWFLLTGKKGNSSLEIKSKVILLNEIGNPKDWNYDKPYFFTPVEIEIIKSWLENINEKELRNKFNHKQFIENQIYAYDADLPEDMLELYLSKIKEITAYFIKASNNKNYIIVYTV